MTLASEKSLKGLVLFRSCNKTNLEGPQKYKDCVYPFIYNGLSYDYCAPREDDKGKTFCATKTDPDHQLIKDQFGFCDSDCNLEPLSMFGFFLLFYYEHEKKIPSSTIYCAAYIIITLK